METEREESGVRSYVTVVVPTRDRREIVVRCLSALIADVAADGAAEIIVIDQGSRDGLEEYLSLQEGIQVIKSEVPTVAALRNVGWRRARGTILYFLDSDVEITSGQIHRIRSRITDDGMIVGCTYALPSDASWTETRWFDITAVHENREVEYLNGGNIATSIDLLHSIDGFNEHLSSGEDVDFCERARRHGAKVVQYTDLAAMHHGNPKNLRSLFAKQMWHGSGAEAFDRIAIYSLISIATSILLIGGIFFLRAAEQLQWKSVIAVACLALGAPPLLLYLRWRRGRAIGWTLASDLLLIWIYLVARACSWVAARYRSVTLDRKSLAVAK